LFLSHKMRLQSNQPAF